MSKIFLAYNLKESADLAGRIYDRLSGYFGNERVVMANTTRGESSQNRNSDDKQLEAGDLLLVLIGPSFLTPTEEPHSSLDDPSAKLRLEITAAQKLGATIIPVLVHQAHSPASEDLPSDIGFLADLRPTEIQSGLPFNTDMRKLIDRLELDMGLKRARPFRWELILIPLGLILTVTGLGFLATLPPEGYYVQSQVAPQDADAGPHTPLTQYDRDIRRAIFFCTIPLGLGPLLIVAGGRWCCLTQEQQSEAIFFTSGIGRRRIPKSGKAVACFGLGLASIAFGISASVLAILAGIWTFVDTHVRHGWLRGRSLAVFGMLLAITGGINATNIHLSWWRLRDWLVQVERAEEALASGNKEAALTAYQQSYENHPQPPYAEAASRHRRAVILAESGEPSLAIEELTQLIDAALPLTDGSLDYYMREQLCESLSMRSQLFNQIGEYQQSEYDESVRQALLFDSPIPAKPSLQTDTPDGNSNEEVAPPAPLEYQEDIPPDMPPPVVDPRASLRLSRWYADWT